MAIPPNGDGQTGRVGAVGEVARRDAIRDNIVKTRIAPDLLATLNPVAPEGKQVPTPPGPQQVIIEVSSTFPGGSEAARALLIALFDRAGLLAADQRLSSVGLDGLRQSQTPPLESWPRFSPQVGDVVDLYKSLHTENYIFASLAPDTIEAVASLETTPPGKIHPIYKVWRDHPVEVFVFASAQTIKCDAARIAFGTSGENIVWAVADTGVNGKHAHFKRHGTLTLPDGLRHQDFTQIHASDDGSEAAALVDAAGHGTHVAGIIAGETVAKSGPNDPDGDAVDGINITSRVRQSKETGPAAVVDQVTQRKVPISGLAPKCTILSLKVLQAEKGGASSNLIAAMGYIRKINGTNGNLKIHGLNLSLGYPFEAEWFAAGQSPLCLEVNRLVRSGVVVVAAAGNAGYGRVTSQQGTSESAALMCTIADPGNAELAITVGSTHRDSPHAYGVSYFSAKGPTADGRMKPDILAPGERIVSCDTTAPNGGFKEDTGTSMAAPHVSGAIAGFLSVRREYIEHPEDVKAIFVSAATDLKRRPEFQGGGLIDLMRALQSV